MIRKEAWSFYKTISGVRLCWELEKNLKDLRELRLLLSEVPPYSLRLANISITHPPDLVQLFFQHCALGPFGVIDSRLKLPPEVRARIARTVRVLTCE